MWAPVVRELLVAPESKLAHLLMMSMYMLTVWRRVATARAYGWVGVGQVCNIVFVRFILYCYRPPLIVRSCCTIPDWVGPAALAWVGASADRCCWMTSYYASLQYQVEGGGDIVGPLVCSDVGSKTPTAGCHGKMHVVAKWIEEGGGVVDGHRGGGRVGAACLLTVLGRMVLCMPRLETPMVLVRVAARWWFSPGWAHVALVWLFSMSPSCVLQ